MTDLTEKSKFLAYLLRHQPQHAGLSLDKQGWCDVDQLVANTNITRDELASIVQLDEKGRYSFSPDGKKIRANQGHSTKEVDLTFKSAVPPAVLFHGTTSHNAGEIQKRGLLPMRRAFVHMSADKETALSVGGRRKGDIVIFMIDAKRALADGIKFFLSDNGVWLSKHIPADYLVRTKE